MSTLRVAPRQAIALALAAVLLVAYPLVAAMALERWSPRVIAWLWIALGLAALGARRKVEDRAWPGLALQALPGMSLLAWAAALDTALPLRLLPALVNATLAVLFLRSLGAERSIIETGARLIEPRLPEFTRPYCRKSTVIWALFFLANALAMSWLAGFGSEAAWAAYTTRTYFIAMVLFGAGEFLVRKLYFRHYGGGPVDGMLAALFPAENTAMGRRSAAHMTAQRAAERAAEVRTD